MGKWATFTGYGMNAAHPPLPIRNRGRDDPMNSRPIGKEEIEAAKLNAG